MIGLLFILPLLVQGFCPQGNYYYDDDECIPCESGKYNNMANSEDCYNITQSDSDKICFINSTDVECCNNWEGSPIYEGGEYERGCVCPRGKKIDNDDRCVLCPSGRYNNKENLVEECPLPIPSEGFCYFNNIQVQCCEGWVGTPEYQDGEYETGCVSSMRDVHPCGPGRYNYENYCFDCPNGKYNHGGCRFENEYCEERCYSIIDREITYLNSTDVVCSLYWMGTPIYEDGEYETGCIDAGEGPTSYPTRYPTGYPSLNPSSGPSLYPTNDPSNYPSRRPTYKATHRRTLK